MSVQPRPWPEVSEQTAVVARAAFPKGLLAMRVREELPGLFTDEQFTSAFGVRGKPGISPGQLRWSRCFSLRRTCPIGRPRISKEANPCHEVVRMRPCGRSGDLG